MYKNTQEIKDIFGIDITEKNRTTPYNVLRYFFAEMREKELRGIPNHFEIVAKELNFKRLNMYNCLLKAETLRKDKSTRILFEAFKNKDKSLFEQFLINNKEYRKNYRKQWGENKAIKTYEPPKIVKIVSKLDRRKPLLSNLKLAEFLRANKILKHEVWDKNVKNISPNQWKQVRNINKKMFDSLIN